MTFFIHSRGLSILLILISITYLAWSQFALFQYRENLKREKLRVNNIASFLELRTHIFEEYNGYFDREKLESSYWGVKSSRVVNEDGLVNMDDGDIFYSMYYKKLSDNKLRRYTSELVLHNFFSVITDRNGRIKRIFWDKP